MGTIICRILRHLHNDVDRDGSPPPCARPSTATARVARAGGGCGNQPGPPADATLGAGSLAWVHAHRHPVVAFAAPEIRPRLEVWDGGLAPGRGGWRRLARPPIPQLPIHGVGGSAPAVRGADVRPREAL